MLLLLASLLLDTRYGRRQSCEGWFEREERDRPHRYELWRALPVAQRPVGRRWQDVLQVSLRTDLFRD